jgi:hypothetical protein
MEHKSRTIEHLQSQGTDIARRSSVPKRGEGAAPIHPGFANRTHTSLGAPPTGAPPDASSPLPTDPSRQVKSFPVPAVTHGMKSDPQRGSYDPAFAEHIMNEATRAPDDYARNLHATLPRDVNEN